MSRLATTALGLLCVAAAASAQEAVPTSSPPPPAVKVGSQVVSGLSAGAFAAVQLHVANAGQFVGAGIIAGGPFYCAADSQETALTSCMSAPAQLNVADCVSAAQQCQGDSSKCDPASDLAKQRVWLFSGTGDTVVNPGVMKKTVQFYEKFMPASSVNSTFGVPAEHSWVTSNYGSSCGTLGSPYINNCGVNAALDMMTFVLGAPQKAGGTADQSRLYTIDQNQFAPGKNAKGISMGPNAYVYVPEACAGGATECTLVTQLHGCTQSIDDVGMDFIMHTQMTALAETNNYVVLFPQVIKSYFSPVNPSACFDWWGYTGPDYATKTGKQNAVISSLIASLTA